MKATELKPCPFCGEKINITTHAEWDNDIGVVYGALIHHKCKRGMEVGIYAVHYLPTIEDAYDMLKNAWNRRVNDD